MLLLSGQSFGAAITLVKDEAGDRIYPVQSEILARSILEGLGVVLALRESPEEGARLHSLDWLRHLRSNCATKTFTLAGETWVAWAHVEWQMIQTLRAALRVTPEEWEKLPSWPRPSKLTPRYLTGSAAAAWELLYFVWYSDLSIAAHQKGSAVP